MRSRALARVVIATLGVSLVITIGCGSSPGGPSPTPTPGVQPPSASQRAALALFEAAILHAELTTSPLTWATDDGYVYWTNGPCEFASQGSLQASLDGGVAPTSGTFLPTGSHTYVVSFSNCLVDGWSGTLNGVASAAYTAAEWSNVTATVSADSVRGRNLAIFSELTDVTADGSAVWTRVGSSSSTHTTTYTPATGSRLVKNSTTNVVTFGGGSYSVIRYPAKGTEQRFDNLKVAINGTEYTLSGSIDTTYGSSGSNIRTGEVRIINNGILVARVYGDRGNDLRVEVLVPLVPF